MLSFCYQTLIIYIIAITFKLLLCLDTQSAIIIKTNPMTGSMKGNGSTLLLQVLIFLHLYMTTKIER